MEGKNKYQQGKIYKIISNVSDDVYYGSTTEPQLARRLAGHKKGFNDYLKGSCHYMTSFKILEQESYDIVLIENYPCNCKNELHKRERFYIENNKCVNKVIPTRTTKEYRTDNKEKIKKYEELNKDKRKQNLIKWSEENKEHLLEYRKKYREENEDKISNGLKEYRENNKAMIRTRATSKVQCECGKMISKGNIAEHRRTASHLKNVN